MSNMIVMSAGELRIESKFYLNGPGAPEVYLKYLTINDKTTVELYPNPTVGQYFRSFQHLMGQYAIGTGGIGGSVLGTGGLAAQQAQSSLNNYQAQMNQIGQAAQLAAVYGSAIIKITK